VSVDESSQFASALLLSGGIGGWQIEAAGANAEELPYVEMTRALMRAFPAAGGRFVIEPDASSGSYFWAAGWLLGRQPATAGSKVEVRHWPTSGWQIDARFPSRLPLPGALSRERDLGDSIMTAIVLAPFADGITRFTDLGRLRVQECERVAALRTELGKCGARSRRAATPSPSTPARCTARRSRPTAITAWPCASRPWAWWSPAYACSTPAASARPSPTSS
jgi:3-phosphoshikimate 1-carboxyvinyltransferase